MLLDESFHGLMPSVPINKQRSLKAVEQTHILTILEQCWWVIEGPKGAAGILEMHPATLRSRMKKLGIQRPS